MKINHFILIAAAMIAAASCAEQLVPDTDVQSPVEMVAAEFNANVEINAATATKTTLNANKVEWLAGDELSVFDGTNNTKGGNAFTTASSGASAIFTGSVAADAKEIYAVYPFRANAEFHPETATITTELPSAQCAVADGFGDDIALMLAKAEGKDLNFKNVGALIKVTVPAEFTDIKSITLKGNANEAICGEVSLQWNNGNPTVKATAPETYVTLRAADGGNIAAGTYHFSILPVEFTKGMTFIFTDSKGDQKQISTSKAVPALQRNQLLPIAALPADKAKPCVNHYIKWQDGFAIDFGGVLCDKTTNSRPAVLLTDVSANKSISKNGVFFIEPDAKDILIESGNYTEVLVAGNDPATRSTITRPKGRFTLGHKDGTTELVALKGLNYVPGHADAHLFVTNADGGFDHFVVDNCKFETMGKFAFFYMSTEKRTISKFTMKNCDVKMTAAGKELSPLFSTGKWTSTIEKVELQNNIFYAPENLQGTKLINSKFATIDNLIMDNNTIVNLYFNKEGLVVVRKLNKAHFNSNLLYMPDYASLIGTQYWGIIFADGLTADGKSAGGKDQTFYPAKGQIEALGNIAYRTATVEGGPQQNKTVKLTYKDLRGTDNKYYPNIDNPFSKYVSPFTLDDKNSFDLENGVFKIIDPVLIEEFSNKQGLAGAQR